LAVQPGSSLPPFEDVPVHAAVGLVAALALPMVGVLRPMPALELLVLVLLLLPLRLPLRASPPQVPPG